MKNRIFLFYCSQFYQIIVIFQDVQCNVRSANQLSTVKSLEIQMLEKYHQYNFYEISRFEKILKKNCNNALCFCYVIFTPNEAQNILSQKVVTLQTLPAH